MKGFVNLPALQPVRPCAPTDEALHLRQERRRTPRRRGRAESRLAALAYAEARYGAFLSRAPRRVDIVA
ncbi:MAG: hypothetical protein GC153_06260 [Alphaproteobacteria bacterium]|nr:hypothetical protein [Alphaproteobacteria bacterium]